MLESTSIGNICWLEAIDFPFSNRRLGPRRLHEACSLVPLREVETAYGWDFMVQQRFSAIKAFEENRKIDYFSF